MDRGRVVQDDGGPLPDIVRKECEPGLDAHLGQCAQGETPHGVVGLYVSEDAFHIVRMLFGMGDAFFAGEYDVGRSAVVLQQMADLIPAHLC